MLNFKNKGKSSLSEMWKENVSFISESSERPSGNTDFPFWHATLRTVGASFYMNWLCPHEHARMHFTISQASLIWVKPFWPVSTASPKMQTSVSGAACVVSSALIHCSQPCLNVRNKQDGQVWLWMNHFTAIRSSRRINYPLVQAVQQ